MVKKISKKFISVLLTMCISFSLVSLPFAGTKKSAPIHFSASAGVWGTSLANFGINKLYTAGFTLCGTLLSSLANSTESDEFKKVVSIVNKYVFGTSSGQAMADIKALCNQILDELNQIDAKLTSYTTEMTKMMGQTQYNEAYYNVNETWKSDVLAYENQYNVGIALNSYKTYLNVADEYAEGTKTSEDVENAKKNLYNAFLSIYTSKKGSFDSNCSDASRRDAVFVNEAVSDALRDTINNMIIALANDNNYADAAAQLAFSGLPFATDQYEYIRTAIDKQFTEIMLLEMLYQEYLSQKGEYFEDNYPQNIPENATKWENYYKELTETFKGLNEDVTKAMSDMLDRELKISPVNGIKLKLDEFPKPEDAGSVVLLNEGDTSNPEDWTYYFMEEAGTPEGSELSPAFVKKETKFNRVFTLTQNGINSFMILDGTQYDSTIPDNDIPDNLHLTRLVQKIDKTASGDVHKPSDDFIYLIERGVYSDQTNTNYKPIKSGDDMKELFNTNAFNLCGSIPSKYLSDYLSYTHGKKTYFMTPAYKMTNWDYTDQSQFSGGEPTGGWNTSYAQFTAIDADAEAPATVFEPVVVSAEGVQTDKEGYPTAYSVILTNNNKSGNSEIFNQTTSVEVNDSGAAEIYIKNENEEKVTSSTQAAGSELTIRFKLTGYNAIPDSITMQRFNDASDKSKVTSEVDILTREQISSLEADDDGYYTFKFNAPYSDIKINLNAYRGYSVSIDETPTTPVTLDSNSNTFIHGDTVNVIADKSVESLYLNKTDNSQIQKLELKNSINGTKTASFDMPDYDVKLTYEIDSSCDHSFDSNGFCSLCNSYQPADVDILNRYKITNAGTLCWFAALVNGDSTFAEFDAPNNEANAVLIKDIYVNSGNMEYATAEITWIPIGSESNPYMGKFYGMSHKISGLYYSNTDVDAKNIGLFGYTNGAVIQNVGVVNSHFEGCSHIGGIIGYNYKSSVKCCYSDAKVVSYYSSGGIVGYNKYGTITECYNTGSIELVDYASTATMAGGVCGQNDSGTITNCYNTGVINSDSSSESYVGGVCGSSSQGRIENCYNTGTASATGFSACVGGVCGRGSTIINCYNDKTGTVIATGLNSNAGGVCGMNCDSTIANCYNLGGVSGSGYSGMVCGNNYRGAIANCYFDSTGCLNALAVGISNSNVTNTNVTGKETSKFNSGEVAYLLSQGCMSKAFSSYNDEINYDPIYVDKFFDGSVWGQTLTGDNKQDYPVLGGKKVIVITDNNGSKYVNDIIIYGQSVTLDGTIGMNIYVEADDDYTDWTASFNDEEVEKPAKGENGLYKFTYEVAAKDMELNIKFSLSNGDSVVVSVKGYLDELEKNSSDTSLIALAEAMETYGNAASEYFKTDGTVQPVSGVADTDCDGYGFTQNDPPTGISYYGSSLILESETTVRHYFKLDAGHSIGEFTFTVDGNEVAPKAKQNYYYVDVENISAENLGVGHTVTVKDNDTGSSSEVISGYCALSYAKTVLNSTTADDNLKNLVKTLYLYNQKALAYNPA